MLLQISKIPADRPVGSNTRFISSLVRNNIEFIAGPEHRQKQRWGPQVGSELTFESNEYIFRLNGGAIHITGTLGPSALLLRVERYGHFQK
jgi:hypothetical protein